MEFQWENNIIIQKEGDNNCEGLLNKINIKKTRLLGSPIGFSGARGRREFEIR